MTNPAPEELIPFLAHKDRLVRSYTARLLGLDRMRANPLSGP